ncbi:hypothetical protein [Bacillus piscicola]|uniref:hypothetical protein n=1 Tax=Bacillus piscicola TaxID=1632684 RepID=UPI001F091543|nr:hypothetical protein [Bacillus piscicola]
MKAYRRKFYYLGSNHRKMEPISMDRIRQAGFDVNVLKKDLPYFISFCREWRSFFNNEAKNMHPLYRPYIEEAAAFFDEQIEQMTLCTAPQYDSDSYIVPFTELVSALMLAYNAFDRVLDVYQSMPVHFDKALTYYRQFNVYSDVDKAQFILNHLPDLRLSIE